MKTGKGPKRGRPIWTSDNFGRGPDKQNQISWAGIIPSPGMNFPVFQALLNKKGGRRPQPMRGLNISCLPMLEQKGGAPPPNSRWRTCRRGSGKDSNRSSSPLRWEKKERRDRKVPGICQ